MQIAVLGLGKLGSVLAALHASSGNQVVGFDLDAGIVSSLKSGKAPFIEPGLQGLIDLAGENLRASHDPEEAIKVAEASIVIVPTPSRMDGTFSNEYVVNAVQAIGKAISKSQKRHTVIIASTVMPGSCIGEISDALESSSGKKVGEGVGLVYNPQFIALGSIVNNMRRPDLVLIGESDSQSGQVAVDLALACAENRPAISRVSLSSAELAKLAINTFVTTKISFANMLGEFCDFLDGADIDEVTSAVGSDSRIGKKYLQGALGYGGPCFPRDNIALVSSAKSFGIDASIASGTDSINDRQVERIVALVMKFARPGAKISVFGLSYKPDTPVCEESQSIEIANSLTEAGFQVSAYDELVVNAPGLSSKVQVQGSVSDTVLSSDVAVFTHPAASFKELDLARLKSRTIIDIWGSIVDSELTHSSQIIRPGRNLKKGLA